MCGSFVSPHASSNQSINNPNDELLFYEELAIHEIVKTAMHII